MEYARIRKEESEMEMETGMHRKLTHEDLKKMGLDRKGKWQYTVADIEALPEGVYAELIDGEIFVWMEAPAVIHQDILMGLSFQVELYIQKKKGKCRVFPAPFGVYIKNDQSNLVMPDIALICDDDKLEKGGCYGPPDLVIEIVSPSNKKMDYVRKLALYQEAGVREYWIVDPKKETVTVYHWEKGDTPTLYPFSERIKVGVYDDLYLDIENRHNTLEEVLTEEKQAGRADGYAEGREDGRADGLRAGEARFIGLTATLLKEGRTDDLNRALVDFEYRRELYKTLHL